MKAYVAGDKDDTLWLCSSEPAFIDEEIGMVCDFKMPLFDEDYEQFSHIRKLRYQKVSITFSKLPSEYERERAFIQHHGGIDEQKDETRARFDAQPD